jgi:protein-arginine kinase
LIRNVKGYPLVPGLKKKQRIELMEKIEKCCEEFEDDLQGIFYKLEDISESDKKLISNLISLEPKQEDDSFQHLAGETKDWPSGRAIFTNIDQTFFIHVNHSDHMKITFRKDSISIQDFLERFMEIL